VMEAKTKTVNAAMKVDNVSEFEFLLHKFHVVVVVVISNSLKYNPN
jgi:hypothetical protein